MKVSRLDISLMLQVNQGVYTCHSSNLAGSVGRNYTIIVAKGGALVTPRSNDSVTSESFIKQAAGDEEDAERETQEQQEVDRRDQQQATSDISRQLIRDGENSLPPFSRAKDAAVGNATAPVTRVHEITLLPLLIGMITGMILVLVTFTIVLFAMYPCAKIRGHLNLSHASSDTTHPSVDTCYPFTSQSSSSSSSCYKLSAVDRACTFTPINNFDNSSHSVSFASASRDKIASISDTLNREIRSTTSNLCRGQCGRKRNVKIQSKCPKISFSSSPLTSNGTCALN